MSTTHNTTSKGSPAPPSSIPVNVASRKKCSNCGGGNIPTSSAPAPAQRVRVTSTKVQPKMREGAVRQSHEDLDLINADVEVRSTRMVPPPHHEDVNSSDDDNYYTQSPLPPPDLDERVEQLKEEFEERMHERGREMRLRQHVARRPGTLVRTKHGRLKAIAGAATQSPSATPLAISDGAYSSGKSVDLTPPSHNLKSSDNTDDHCSTADRSLESSRQGGSDVVYLKRPEKLEIDLD